MLEVTRELVLGVLRDVRILAVASEYVDFDLVGNLHVGECPFCQISARGFSVDDARGCFKCEDCGEGGDSISFIERLLGLDVLTSVRYLSQKYSVEPVAD